MLVQTTLRRGLGADAVCSGSEWRGSPRGVPRDCRGRRLGSVRSWRGVAVSSGKGLLACASGERRLVFVPAHRSGRKLGLTLPTIKLVMWSGVVLRVFLCCPLPPFLPWHARVFTVKVAWRTASREQDRTPGSV